MFLQRDNFSGITPCQLLGGVVYVMIERENGGLSGKWMRREKAIED
jgi:hypothetical protein